MGITSIIVLIIIVGAIAGWLAGQIVKGFGFGLIGNIVGGTVGAEHIGADVRNDAHWPIIRQVFIDHSVITLRAQSITPDDHIAFARADGARST